MPRYSRLPVELTSASDSPAVGEPANPVAALPGSFADWLAQPSRTITAGPEPEEGIFVPAVHEGHGAAGSSEPHSPPPD